jgi:formate-dependent nitrite reductase membrane component NrfD
MLWAPGSGLESILTWVVGAAALFIVLYPGLELAASRSIPFWSTMLVPLQFLSSALASAAGLAWVISWLMNSPAPSPVAAVVALAALLATLLFSLIHIQSARSQQGAARMSADKAMKGSLSSYFLWGNLVLGLMAPGLILALYLAHALPSGFLLLAGVLLLVGNFLAKYTVLKAGYYASLL